jgi:hypothetical protein
LTPKQVIKFYGSQAAAARKLRYSRSHVCNWVRNNKIPLLAQARIEKETKGELTMRAS